MTYEEKYKRAFEIAKEVYHDHRKDRYWRDWLTKLFPELNESEDEKIRKTIIRFFKDNYPNETGMYDGTVTVGKALAWLEKQQPLDKEELAEGALKHVAQQFMNWLDASTPEDKMCLSNMECEDIEAAFLKDDWARIANYIKKKLEKQGEQETAVYVPKFHVGDVVKSKSQPVFDARKIISIDKDCYWCEDKGCIGFAWEDDYELVEQKTDEQSENPCSGCTNIKGCITCLNGDQRQTSTLKILYSDEVLEWLERNSSMFWDSPCNPSRIVKLFKKDFLE